MSATSVDGPPPYFRTVYDETLRSKFYMEPSIMSMANRPNLLGQLDRHSPTTDGSFSICVANGNGVFISQALLESIPLEHRPALDTRHADMSVEMLACNPMTSIGSTFIPVIFTDAQTGENFRVVLYALVLPNLLMNMFIGMSVDFFKSQSWGNGIMHTFDFGQGGVRQVKGM